MTFSSIMRQEVRAMATAFALDEDHAFPAWVAKIALDLDDDDAYDALSLEGPNEKGMDVFWVDQQNKRVFIAQCKYSQKANHRPRMKDLNDFLACTDWLASPEDLAREGRPELASAANEFNEAVSQDYATQLWFVYCGPRDENVDKRIRLYNANPDNEQRNRSAIHCHIDLLESIYEEWRGEGRRIESAQVQVASQGFEVGGAFGKGVVVSLPAPELVRLYGEFGDQLFARNVRGWLGARKGSVNAAIIATLENDKERGNFWAYNNGITIVCDDYHYDPDAASLRLENFSIVNGCQTTVALAKSGLPPADAQVLILARVICPPETIIDSVIRFTNSQNLIRRWDLASQDAVQRRLKREFEDLADPVYYAIRRGEWAALPPAEKAKFKPPSGSARTVKHDLLAQYLAAFRGMAVVAYKNKAFLFDRYYDQTFPADIRVEDTLFVWRAGEIVQAQVREEIRAEADKVTKGDKDREKYVLMLKRGGRFYVLAVLGVVARLRNGNDYLRSITEERTTSKAATERIEKYAQVSVQWYKQAVDDLRAISGTDLSVLIREADFFQRVAERVTNQYQVMKVNETWLSGALPKLY
jgi:hypothetical protein